MIIFLRLFLLTFIYGNPILKKKYMKKRLNIHLKGVFHKMLCMDVQ